MASKDHKAALLAAALKKKRADDDDAPRPALGPSAPSSDADRDAFKLRKSNLLGVASWDAMVEKLTLNGKHDFDAFHATMAKMLGNVLAKPAEPKYRKLRPSNPTFSTKVYSLKGAPELLQLVGFKESVEADGTFLVLPTSADLEPLQRALGALDSQAAARLEGEEKKRKLDAEKAAKARDERREKARDEAASSAYGAAAAGASGTMIDEDEAMVSAISAWMDAHPDVMAGRDFDSFEIERQVPGPGGVVVATVIASTGTQYFDCVAFMQRGAGGRWTVTKVEIA
ncbi:hypothetical protein T492DRAFT_1040867 [Pavlovales sp. CCMP2436]|nr:hypothetical protein T492DRAFT_1040867 [Pavlovales sp. CCMP2436]|mmetsp:Transcript_12412/g.31413  ORF Transcript_12412/g.31413 Transcript_12412/m.31413 type:complete len:285 (-) Transcript_12412:190-1044(-)